MIFAKMVSLFLWALIGSSFAEPAGAEEIVTVVKETRQEEVGTYYRQYNNQNVMGPEYGDVEYLIVTARTDVTITKVIVNRGNCIPYFKLIPGLGPIPLDLPSSLKFGDALKMRVDCNPIEVVVETDKGTIPVTWEN